MRKIIVLVFLISIANSGLCNSYRVDSLLSVFNNKNLDDSTRIEALLLTIDEPKYLKIDKNAKKVSELFSELAKDKNNKLAKCLSKEFGHDLSENLPVDSLITRNNKSAETFGKLGYNSGRLISLGNLLRAYQIKQDDEACRRMVDTMLHFQKFGTIPWVEYLTYYSISTYYLGKNNMAQAIFNMNRSIKTYVLVGNRLNIAVRYHHLADLYLKIKDIKKSEFYHNKSLQIFKRIENNEGIARINFHQANELYISEKYSEALDLLQKTIGLAKSESFIFEAYAMAAATAAHLNDLLVSKNYIDSCLANEKYMSTARAKFGQIVNYYYSSKYDEIILQVSSLKDFKDQSPSRALEMVELAYLASKKLNLTEKALKYMELQKALEDSFAINENKITLDRIELELKIKNDSIKQVETLRLQKEKEEALIAAKTRKNRIQYSLVILVVLLLATVIAVVTKFSISPRLASGLIFIFFILTFEFLLVVLDPWVDSISNGEVGWKIGINTAIALVLFGIHQVSEKRLKNAILKVDK